MSYVKVLLRPAVRRVRALFSRPGPVILMYHRIAEESFDPWGMAVSPDHFAEQAEWLGRNRKVLPLTEFAAAHTRGELPEDSVAVTFDDGYACTFTTAAPILRKVGLPATVFVPAETIRRGGEFWWDELERLVLESNVEHLILDGQKIPLADRSEQDRRWRPYAPPRTARQRAFKRLWSMIHRKDGDAVDAAMASLRGQTASAQSRRDSHRVASAHEVGSCGLAIGCHGLAHASLPQLDRGEQVREIEEGKALLAKLTGKEPATFSFPFGQRDSHVRKLVERAGFVCACSSRQSFVHAGDDVFDLPRLVVEDVGAAGFERMLSGR